MAIVNPELFAAFAVAATALVLLPGPIVTLVVANAVGHGARTGLATAAGAGAGNALLVAAGTLGLTALLAVVGDLLAWVRWAGVAYLLWLGLRHWRAALRGAPVAAPAGGRSVSSAFGQGALVAVTNPKTILFTAAFFPQFVDPALAAGPQLAVMSLAFVALGLAGDGAYAVASGRIRPWLTGRRSARIRDGLTGTLFVATGLALAAARR